MVPDVGSFYKIALTSDREGRLRAGTSLRGHVGVVLRGGRGPRPWAPRAQRYNRTVRPAGCSPAVCGPPAYSLLPRPTLAPPGMDEHAVPSSKAAARRDVQTSFLAGVEQAEGRAAWKQTTRLSANTQKVCGRYCAQREGASLRPAVGEVC